MLLLFIVFDMGDKNIQRGEVGNTTDIERI